MKALVAVAASSAFAKEVAIGSSERIVTTRDMLTLHLSGGAAVLLEPSDR